MKDTFVNNAALTTILTAMDVAVQPASSVAPNINVLALGNQANVMMNNARAIFAVPAGTDTATSHAT